jgi:hypothetical protein
MVVSPKRCLMVTGKAMLTGWLGASDVVELAGPVEQAVRVSATAARRAAARPAVLRRRRPAGRPAEQGKTAEATELLR